jgi:MFS family permease
MDADAKKNRFFYGYVVAAAGFIAWFIGWGSYSTCFGLFFKPLLSEFQWTRAETSFAFSVALLVQATLGVVTGWLTDRLGPRIVVTVFGSFLGWSFLLISQVHALWQLVVAYAIVGGIGSSILNIPIMATVSRWFVKRRGLMTGLVQSGAGLGGFFLAPFTGHLIIRYGWRNASIILGIITLALIVLAGLLLIRDPRDAGQFADGIQPENETPVKPQREKKQVSGFPLRVFISTSPFWVMTGIYACFGYFRSTFTTHAAAHVQDMGFSLYDGANVVAVISASSIVGRIGMGRLADNIGTRRALVISFMVTTLIIGWLLTTRNLWGLYLFAAVYGFGWGALAVLRFAITAEVFGLASVGFIMGTLGFSESLIAAFGSYFGGFVFDLSGNYDQAFLICMAISFTGVFLSWRLKPKQFPGRQRPL